MTTIPKLILARLLEWETAVAYAQYAVVTGEVNPRQYGRAREALEGVLAQVARLEAALTSEDG